jgi:hypothetical protein
MPPRLSREGTHRLEQFLLGGLCLNLVISFGSYFNERSKASSRQAELYARLDAAKEAAALKAAEGEGDSKLCVGHLHLVGINGIASGAVGSMHMFHTIGSLLLLQRQRQRGVLQWNRRRGALALLLLLAAAAARRTNAASSPRILPPGTLPPRRRERIQRLAGGQAP